MLISTKMKKSFMMFLLGGIMTMPTIAQTCPDNDDDTGDYPGVWRSPARLPRAYINYDEASGFACVHFLSVVNNVEISVYLNGTEVDTQVVDAEKGTQALFYLPVYGTGEFLIQVKRGSMLIATYSTTL